MVKKIFLGLAAVAAVAVLGVVGMMYSVGMFASEAVHGTANGAIDGYDPVAYHLDGAAVPGSNEHTHVWKGATWRFSSAANRDLFAADPERYAPAYGGYCAAGMAGGYTAYTDPNAFTVVGEVLYLNFDASVQQDWLADRDRLIEVADENWAAHPFSEVLP